MPSQKFYIPEDSLAQPSAEVERGYRKLLYGGLLCLAATAIVVAGWAGLELLYQAQL